VIDGTSAPGAPSILAARPAPTVTAARQQRVSGEQASDTNTATTSSRPGALSGRPARMTVGVELCKHANLVKEGC